MADAPASPPAASSPWVGCKTCRDEGRRSVHIRLDPGPRPNAESVALAGASSGSCQTFASELEPAFVGTVLRGQQTGLGGSAPDVASRHDGHPPPSRLAPARSRVVGAICAPGDDGHSKGPAVLVSRTTHSFSWPRIVDLNEHRFEPGCLPRSEEATQAFSWAGASAV